MSPIESARGDIISYHMVQCYEVRVSDVVIMSDPHTYTQKRCSLMQAMNGGYGTGARAAWSPRGV